MRDSLLNSYFNLYSFRIILNYNFCVPFIYIDLSVQPERLISSTRGRKRMTPYKPRSTPSKRGRRISGANEIPLMPPPDTQVTQQPRFNEPVEKPDANMALKYTFGVNAWRHWVNIVILTYLFNNYVLEF